MIYPLRVPNVSRAAGPSAVASCLYITSRRMRDERTGEALNKLGCRERVEHACTMLPEGAPGEYLDPERSFSAVEMVEKRSDARPAKRIMAALPCEFDARERFCVLEDLTSWNTTANGYACMYAIHTDEDGRDLHAHILVVNRYIDPKTSRWVVKSRSKFASDANDQRIPVIDPDTGRQKIGARNRKVWKRVNVSNDSLNSKEFPKGLRREWVNSCNALLPGYVVVDHRSFKARGTERTPTIHEGYVSREVEKRDGGGDLCKENRRIQALNQLLDALRVMIGRFSDQAQGILTAVKHRQRSSGVPQAPLSPGPAERLQERPQARETPSQAPQEPPKPIRTGKALTDRFKIRFDEWLAENERKQAKKQAEPDMEETWGPSDPANPLNIGMGWDTGGHGPGLRERREHKGPASKDIDLRFRKTSLLAGNGHAVDARAACRSDTHPRTSCDRGVCSSIDYGGDLSRLTAGRIAAAIRPGPRRHSGACEPRVTQSIPASPASSIGISTSTRDSYRTIFSLARR